MWEAADVQWWWRTPRVTDEVELPVWLDDAGPVAAAGLTAFSDTWQVDAFAVPGAIGVEDVWSAALDVAAERHVAADGSRGGLETFVFGGDPCRTRLAVESGFGPTEGIEGTSWLDAGECPPVVEVEGFQVVARDARSGGPHPMCARNGEAVEERLGECPLYDPSLDLSVEDPAGTVAGYALFWFDPITLVGLLEPMRVEDAYQRRGLARSLLTSGVRRLVERGARRIKVGFSTEAARQLYLGAGFRQTSLDCLFVRPSGHAGEGA